MVRQQWTGQKGLGGHVRTASTLDSNSSTCYDRETTNMADFGIPYASLSTKILKN